MAQHTSPAAIPLSALPTAHSDPDLALVNRVLAGDTQAFAGLVQRWQGPLINLAWRYCRDRSRAEERSQEAFIRAWRNLAQWRRDSAFSTWLFSVAANVYRTELKRIPIAHLSLDQVAEPDSPFLKDAYLDSAARDESVRRAVLAMITRLAFTSAATSQSALHRTGFVAGFLPQSHFNFHADPALAGKVLPAAFAFALAWITIWLCRHFTGDTSTP